MIWKVLMALFGVGLVLFLINIWWSDNSVPDRIGMTGMTFMVVSLVIGFVYAMIWVADS
jgi:apolipoprotein N-acyltransferase